MDHLEDVLAPPRLDGLHLDQVAVVVALWDVGVHHLHLARVVERSKGDEHVSVVGPIFELPLHLNLCVLLDLFVHTLDRPIEHLELATGLRVRHGQTPSELANLELISHALVDDGGGHAKTSCYFSLLSRHLFNLYN